jgi:plastocyanin
MRNWRIPFLVLLGATIVWATAQPANIEAHRDDARVALIDDCDPADPAWAPVGCLQKRGDVTAAEFNLFLRSPLYDNDGNPASTAGQFLVGHPSWRNEPSHLVVKEGERIHVANTGGRPHTFTKVAEFGGGRVPPLTVGTQMAPECAAPPTGQTDPFQVAPGDKLRLKTTGEGIMRFQCCFHPWMRATVRVVPKDE